MPDQPIHSHFNLKYALEGRIVTMDQNSRVINRGRIFIENGLIQDIRATNEGYPAGFNRSHVVKSGGTIYPE